MRDVRAASADSTPVFASAGATWTAPDHPSPFELLASRIASTIAGRAVSVHCDTPADWAAVASSNGLDPGGEEGYVSSAWDEATGSLRSVSSVAELDGAGICAPLSDFESALTKPTTCESQAAVVAAARPSPGKQTRAQTRHVSSRLTSSTPLRTRSLQEPCYLGGGKEAQPLPGSYWAGYERAAWAMLTLAHESIHMSGVVGGHLADGTPVGDQDAEAKANCLGMQWVPYVAEQLGDTAPDGQAIASFIWDYMYPPIRLSAHPDYWSAECTANGPWDIRPAGTTAWP